MTKGKIGFGFPTASNMEKGRYITMNLENGPFTDSWRFTRQGTYDFIVAFEFDFEFDNKILSVALGSIFKQL